MQLILILALLLFGGVPSGTKKNGLSELFDPDAVELLKEISGDGEQVDAFVNEVKQISEIVAAFAPARQSAGEGGEPLNCEKRQQEPCGTDGWDVSRVLAPVANIADDSVYNALARAVC